MMEYNVYDFDKTIYDGDSTIDFYKFCVRRYPLALITLPRVLKYFLIYKMGRCSKTRFKEVFYSYLKYVPDIEKCIEDFWKLCYIKIKQWYLNQHEDSDIIISASPQFLLEPICEKLSIGVLIASRVDKCTGKTEGENCWGEEKVRRLKETLHDFDIKEFYSDSLSDNSLAELAEKSYLVRGDELQSWTYEFKKA